MRAVVASAAAVVLVLLALPAAGWAWTATTTGQTLVVSGAPGEVSRFSVDDADADIIAVADGVGVFQGAAPAPCSASTGGAITCPADTGAIVAIEVHGGDRDDKLSNEAEQLPVRLFGDDGDDVLNGGDGPDELRGGAGQDKLTGADGDDRLYGDAGNDVVDGGGDVDVESGGAGDGTFRAADGVDTMFGEDGDDRLAAGDDGSIIDGGAGSDKLEGAGGNDVLAGGAGDDVLTGDSGADGLAGGDGSDRLDGGDGSDGLDGGDGDDALVGGDGANAFAGGAGLDTVDYSQSDGSVSVTIDGRADDGSSGQGDDVGADVERVLGSPEDDTLAAGGALHELEGGDGDDTLTGSPGADTLDGGPGDDGLRGRLGPDALVGGEGTDTALYTERTRDVTVTLDDDKADDGERGERDRVAPTVESVQAGAGNDRLTGSAGVSNALYGNGGNDRLRTRDPRNAAQDTLSCATGTDSIDADAQDTPSDCEIERVDGEVVQYGVSVAARPSLLLPVAAIRVDRRGRGTVTLSCGTQRPTHCRGGA